MTLNKDALADLVSVSTGKTTIDSKELVDLFFETLKNGVAEDGNLSISGFGKFVVKEKNQRRGRNPKTGEEMMLDGRNVVTFHHSQVLKERLNR